MTGWYFPNGLVFLCGCSVGTLNVQQGFDSAGRPNLDCLRSALRSTASPGVHRERILRHIGTVLVLGECIASFLLHKNFTAFMNASKGSNGDFYNKFSSPPQMAVGSAQLVNATALAAGALAVPPLPMVLALQQSDGAHWVTGARDVLGFLA
eukprot:SAG11_NODE_170_length_13624_cov_40.078226_4_plen_152_part_00